MYPARADGCIAWTAGLARSASISIGIQRCHLAGIFSPRSLLQQGGASSPQTSDIFAYRTGLRIFTQPWSLEGAVTYVPETAADAATYPPLMFSDLAGVTDDLQKARGEPGEISHLPRHRDRSRSVIEPWLSVSGRGVRVIVRPFPQNLRRSTVNRS